MPEGQAMQRLEPFLSADTLVADNLPPVDQTDYRVSMLLPVLLSVLVHGVLLLMFIVFATTPRTLIEFDNSRKSVQIRIVPGITVPATAQQDVVDVTDDQISEQAVEEPLAEEPLVDTSVVEIPTSTESAAAPDDESIPTPASAPIINTEIANRPSVAERDLETASRPKLQLPSASGLRQLLKEIGAENENAMSLADCNRLQQENALISCGADENRDLRLPDRNFVYDYFNPRSDPRRSSASVELIAAQTPAVEQRMRAEGVNAALSNFLLYNQIISDEDYRGSAPRPEKRLTDVLNMGDRTYQMIKKTMGE